METEEALYSKYNEDLTQLAENGKSLEESLIYKSLKGLSGQELIEFFTLRFTKSNTFDWEKMKMTILHMVVSYA